MATILDLRDPSLSLPEFLVVDASVLLAVRSVPGAPPSSQSVAAKQFLGSVKQACLSGDTIALVCILTLEECYFKIISWRYRNDSSLGKERAVVARRSGKQPSEVRWHELYKFYPRCIRKYFPEVTAFFQWVAAIPLTIIEPSDLVGPGGVSTAIEQQMRHYIHSCCVLPKDAYLIATADCLGVKHIATLDRDFKRLGTGFTLYTLP